MAGNSTNEFCLSLASLDVSSEDDLVTTGPDADGNASSLASLLNSYEASQKAKINALAVERQKEVERLSLPPKLFNKDQVEDVIIKQCQRLPIYSHKDEIVELVRNNQFVIVLGETGSGKSTQIPQYLAEAGVHGSGKIGVTQPRRIAAKSLAGRVAQECGVELGGQVGYAVRFDKKVSAETVIKYMTDGMLVRECGTETNLDTYSVIIIDEAHERSINTDVCFGILKRAARKRPELRIIISSATLKKEQFSEYFKLPSGENAPILSVSGHSYEVKVHYNSASEDDFMEKAVDQVIAINKSEPRGAKGDILMFLSGQADIEAMEDMIADKWAATPGTSLYNGLWIIPLYGALPLEEQEKIYLETPDCYRKIVLATNVAETSITVDGVVHVIDCGFYKESVYNPKSGVKHLILKSITKFQAIQRKGRAGRTQPGKCYRMYSEAEFEQMMESSEPEMTRSNLESVLLDLIAMGIANPMQFEFMDKPKNEAVFEALIHLKELGALANDYTLTTLGRRMSEFPLDPSLSRVVIESDKLGCSDDVVKIVGIISTNYLNLFYRNKKDRQRANQAKARFTDLDGDLISLLKVYNEWDLIGRKGAHWCKANAIQYRILVEADEIRLQLKDVLFSRGISHGSLHHRTRASQSTSENIRRAFTAGYFRQLANKSRRNAYLTLGNPDESQEVYIHPSSFVCKRDLTSPWVIFQEMTRTRMTYINGITPINVEWIREYAPSFAEERSMYLV